MRYRVSYLMDEIWERAVETALDGQTDHSAARTLTLDGAVKCVQGRLPPPSLLERFENLELLSIANIGVSSLEQFPRLKKLEKLVLSDNRIAGGLEFLVQAGLDSLRDLDLSNNRIQFIEDLAPLAQLKLISLDLYECPVTRVKDYRSRVFAMIKSLKYLDKMDAEENERPESDDEEDDDEEDDEDDPGSGEVDGEDRLFRRDNGHSENIEGVVDAEEDEESDADEEETETARKGTETSHHTNGFRVEHVNGEYVDYEDENYEYDEIESGEEIFEEEDVAAAHRYGESDDEEDGVEDDDEEEDNDDEDEEEEVDNDDIDGYFANPESSGRLTSTGEIDGHEHGEEDGDDDGETGEEEQAIEDEGEFEVEDEEEVEEEEEDHGAGYLVQPVDQGEEDDGGGSDMEAGSEEEVEEEVQDDEEVQHIPAAFPQLKRKRGDDVDEDESGEDDEDVVESSSKKHH
ncbi:acidic leucine-rich nuclear phosphoprotein 32-related protein-like [Mangifera indica]|uniref:acidic leucine-rich nuclear phosphoprotein 32-related protein-like n=1 Tax=Mangifera indica TaxID=29780 RepID=UPI001CFA1D42|nr:acidic leucine-rich nuclear phosphoprotein 32-related protein-like [Mangifera indica]